MWHHKSNQMLLKYFVCRKVIYKRLALSVLSHLTRVVLLEIPFWVYTYNIHWKHLVGFVVWNQNVFFSFVVFRNACKWQMNEMMEWKEFINKMTTSLSKCWFTVYLFSLHVGFSANMTPWRDVSCPLDCSCFYKTFPHTVSDSSLRTIDCSDAGLRRVPSDLPISLQALILRGSKLPISVLGQIPGNLTLLDLSYCQLYTLDYGLPIMPYIRYLNMEHNELDYIANRTFQTLHGLTRLSLAHNTIEMLHSDALCGLYQLSTLDLSHNRLFSLDTRWFAQLFKLEVCKHEGRVTDVFQILKLALDVISL